MSDEATTPFSSQCEIVSDFWFEYRNDEEFKELFEYGDLGFPLAYAITEKMVELTDIGKGYVGEVFVMLLEALGIEEDTGFESLEDLLIGRSKN